MTGIRRLIHEVHRRSLWQVLLVYLGASWGVLQVADQIVTRFALPEWVYAAALLLLLVGLPVVLATAFVQEGIGGRESPDAGAGRESLGGRAAHGAGSVPRAPRRLLTWRNAVAGGVFAFALWGMAAAGWLLLGPGRSSGASAAEETDRRSIAVLPFANRSAEGGEEAAFFAEGVHDDILTQLSKIGTLKVISRTSVMRYAEERKPVREIGRELDVATVLEGGVQRAGDRVRVNVQLIDARTDEHLWAETYDEALTAANVFAIQGDVARRIADALEAALTPEVAERIDRKPTEDLEAYDLYSRGRYLLSNRRTREGGEEALGLFRRAIQLDPAFALAHVGLADAYLALQARAYVSESDALPRARAAIERALALDESLAEAYATRGLLLERELRPREAEDAYRRAIELNPGDARAHQRYGGLLVDLGRPEEAVRESRYAVELDPLTVGTRSALATNLFFVRDYRGTIEEARKVLELEPEFADGYYWLGLAQALEGDTDEGARAIAEAIRMNAEDPYYYSGLAWILAHAGRGPEARQEMKRAKEHGVPVKELAIVLGELGELDAAFRYLDRSLAEEPASLLGIQSDPTADSLRADPRFAGFLREAGLD